LKPPAGAFHFEPQHLADCRRVAGSRNVLFAYAVAVKVLERKINSSLGIVVAHVLPEIGQLQRGAGGIGERLAFGIAISAEIKNEMTHRIRGVAAVAQQVFKSLKASDRLVLAKRFQQIVEWLLRNIKLVYGLFKRDKNSVPRIAGIAGVEFGLPLVEHLERGVRVADFITQIV